MKLHRHIDGIKHEESVVLRKADHRDHSSISKEDSALMIVNTKTDHIIGYVVIDTRGYLAVYYLDPEPVSEDALLHEAAKELRELQVNDLTGDGFKMGRVQQKLNRVGIEFKKR